MMEVNTIIEDPSKLAGLTAQPRRVKKWLKDLPLVNLGETAHQFYNGLLELNRYPATAAKRIECMELLRPVAHDILKNLKRHLIARSLPPTRRTEQVLELYMALMAQMAMGYKIAVHQVANGADGLGAKTAALAAHRAIRYAGEQVQAAAALYTRSPQTVWPDVYAIYQYAENNQLLERRVKDGTYFDQTESTVRECFVQVCLLSLARPQTLRMGEVEKLSAFFEHASRSVRVKRSPRPDAGGNFFFIDLKLERPPTVRSLPTLPKSTFRYLDLTGLIESLRSDQEATGHKDTEAIVNRSLLTADLTQRLLKHLTENPSRRHSRSKQNEIAEVVLGLANICQLVQTELFDGGDFEGNVSVNPEAQELRLANQSNTLGNINGSGFMRPDVANQPISAEAWENVSNGNVILNPETAPPPTPNKVEIVRSNDPNVQRWSVLDRSESGFRLNWPAAEPSQAQVGELLALRENIEHGLQFSIGVIRWMQLQDPQGMDIGVEILATQPVVVTVENLDLSQSTSMSPVEALLLHAGDHTDQTHSLLLPRSSFGEGHRIAIKLFSRKLNAVLATTEEQTGFFTHFRYREEAPQDESAIEEAVEATGDFSALWSKL